MRLDHHDTTRDTRFLFTGDAEQPTEARLLAHPQDIATDYLKVAHHGSRFSSTAVFLDAAHPRFASISCGTGNDYGHPHNETLARLAARHVTVYRTDDNSDIVFTSQKKRANRHAHTGAHSKLARRVRVSLWAVRWCSFQTSIRLFTRQTIALVYALSYACETVPPPTPSPVVKPVEQVETLEKPRILDDGVILGLFAKSKEFFAKYVADAEKYRLQVLYTEIDETRVKRHGFRVDLDYFYPASAIKPVLALGALETIRERDVDVNTPFRVVGFSGGIEERDGAGAKLTVQHEIEKLLIFSDNDAYNRLYSIVGQREANTRMWRMGFDSVRIRHRLMTSGSDDGSRTPRIEFLGDNGGVVNAIEDRTSTLTLPPPGVFETDIGSQHIGDRGEIIAKPMAFAERNRISLVDLQDTLALIVRPDLATALGRKDVPRIRDADREVLMTALAAIPSRVLGSKGSADVQPLDELHKPALAGATKTGRPLKVYSKGGRAYGFLVENACIVDKTQHRGFFLTMTIEVNETGVVGDDRYPYDEVGMPFFVKTAELVTRHAFQPKPKAKPTKGDGT